MAAELDAVNPKVLEWARRRLNLEVAQVAAALGIATETVVAWEAGDSHPTYAQLEKLAYQLFKRPLAVFFFPELPAEPDPKKEFRLLPDFEVDALAADTLLAIRHARGMQESLRELSGNRNPADRPILRLVDTRESSSLESLAARVRDSLGVTLATQMSWPSVGEAFKRWRAALEERGVYVFKRSFEQEEISGFCLYDPDFPVIYINNSTSDSRQIFSLFHELAHLLHANSGVTKEGFNVEALQPDDRRIEIACNRFAAVFLVPEDDFLRRVRPGSVDDNQVGELANLYSVSREVILRKLLDLGRITEELYEAKSRQWNEEWRTRARSSGGNYYLTQASYLSRSFTKMAFASYYGGRCTLQDLAGHLGIKARNISKFESVVAESA